MDAQNQALVWLRILPAIATAGLLIVGGCALDKNGSHPGGVVARIGGHSGQLIEPKRCLLKVAIVTRPFGDKTLNEVVWRVADEQILPPAERRAWEVNGLRVGRIVGELPLELEAILKDTTPQNKVNPTNFFVDSGEPTLIAVGETVEQASLLLNRENRIVGRDYHEPSGFFRLTPQHDGPNNVSLRMVPEIHHGPVHAPSRLCPMRHHLVLKSSGSTTASKRKPSARWPQPLSSSPARSRSSAAAPNSNAAWEALCSLRR